MPRADFYLLPSDSLSEILFFACRLAEKAHRQRHHVYFHMKNQSDAHRLDEMLWTWRDDSFLPHALCGDGPEPAPPILIGTAEKPANQSDILINLSGQLPDFYRAFKRVLEIVPGNADAQAAARERYKVYREQQYQIQTHKTETQSSAVNE